MLNNKLFINSVESIFETLLSTYCKVGKYKKINKTKKMNLIQIDIHIYKIKDKTKTTKFSFFVPQKLATLINFLILGKIVDEKNEIDEEIVDSVNEVISTIIGTFLTDFNNKNNYKNKERYIFSVVKESKIILDSIIGSTRLSIKLNDQNYYMYILNTIENKKNDDFYNDMLLGMEINSKKPFKKISQLKEKDINESVKTNNDIIKNLNEDVIKLESNEIIINSSDIETQKEINILNVRGIILESFIDNNHLINISEGDIIPLGNEIPLTGSYLEINGEKIKEKFKIVVIDEKINFMIDN